jgi:hypothetical protein
VGAAYLAPALVVLSLHQAGVVRALKGPIGTAIPLYYSFATTVSFYGVQLGV